MNAMLLRAPRDVNANPLEFVELETPMPRAKEIRIAVRVCGMCHTDLHTVEGEIELPKTPIVPGHQIVGVVESVGQNVTRFHIGERVGVPWLNSTCGACEFCKRGEENLCEHAHFTGQHVDGGYAEFCVVNENFAYTIPDAFSDAQAAPLLCGGVIGYRALRVCGVKPGERLGLYGFGSSAHIVIQIARHWNCAVSVFTRSDAHRALARELGASWVGRAEETPPQLLDRAIVFAPVGSLIVEALRVLRKGGTVAHAGIFSTPIPQFDYNLLYHERTIRSVANSTRQDVKDLLRVAAEIPVRTAIETFPLREANRALQMLKQSKVRGAGVLEIRD
ncbi:MAG: zinc-dependent alcohol dehydrogenase family protein [Chloroflexi bacterium]|nr:zinc-dependent alcohol dehydrogenase family protein [Chloroflexota bacterium]